MGVPRLPGVAADAATAGAVDAPGLHNREPNLGFSTVSGGDDWMDNSCRTLDSELSLAHSTDSAVAALCIQATTHCCTALCHINQDPDTNALFGQLMVWLQAVQDAVRDRNNSLSDSQCGSVLSQCSLASDLQDCQVSTHCTRPLPDWCTQIREALAACEQLLERTGPSTASSNGPNTAPGTAPNTAPNTAPEQSLELLEVHCGANSEAENTCVAGRDDAAEL